jgi:metal-responsive CopG/Arc/MetJ family transcriptional regulator
MIKRTFVLDDESSAQLDRTADRLGMARSQVVREAVRLYAERADRLTDDERTRALAAFDEAMARLPERPRDEVRAEIDELVRGRRGGGRRRG